MHPRTDAPLLRVARALAVALALAACSGSTPPPELDAAAPASAPSARKGPPLEVRKARFEQRLAVELPPSLPNGWKHLVKTLGARPTAVRHAWRSRTAPGGTWREIALTLRMFGPDEATEQALLSALRTVGVAGLGDALPDAPVEVGTERWSIERFPLVAPPGAPRESRVEIRWARVPPEPSEPERCRKVPGVDPPSDAPAWFRGWAKTGATRRTVGASVRREAKSGQIQQEVGLHVLYRNGWVHDEAVGKLTAAAGRGGLKTVEGSGPRQRLEGAGGVLQMRPWPDPLHLGCEIRGPVLHAVWTDG
jgi:hypothetical protein